MRSLESLNGTAARPSRRGSVRGVPEPVTRPAIIAVADDADVLDAVDAQLVERYGRRYDVQRVRNPDAAARLLQRLADGRVDVALVLAAPSALTGAGDRLFDRARRLHPQAKRALLVQPNAWMNPEGAEEIRMAMALGRVDHFLVEPGPPPDEVFHEAVSSFLLEWARERRLVPHTVHIVGAEWSGRAFELRTVFEGCAVPHQFSLADSERGHELIAKAGPDARLPLMVLPDGRVLSDPSDAEIAAAAGAPEALEAQTFDLVVVGAGPAGLSSAVYGASEGLSVLVVDAAGIGGQARSSSLIRNYLGFAKGVSGGRLAQQAHEQAMVFGARFVFMHRATGLTPDGDELAVSLEDGRSVGARAVILATGASYRRLGIPELEALTGAGVFYGGAVSEAPTLAGKDVYVVGGGNSAGQAALHLARYARRVTLLVRAASLDAGMSQYLVHAVEAAPNVELRSGTTISGGGGEGRLQRLVLGDVATGENSTVEADALFVLIGARPLTEWLPPDIARDRHGFLLTGLEAEATWRLERRPFALETSIPRVFAAGDARRGSVKRVATAVGEGAVAVQLVHQVLADELAAAVDTSAGHQRALAQA